MKKIAQGSIPVDRPYETDIGNLDIYTHYKKSPFHSIKHSSYFQVYSELLDQYRNKPIVFVEVGVLNGGSLFMWREYFGEAARIIGIDFNPIAKRWEKDGFEIHIGSQSDELFWDDFFKKVGEVDVVLDDGGHTYEQQIVTAHKSIPHIRDGGLLIVEDTHTSYFREFGYPSKYSFIEWTKKLIDNINSRFPSVKVSNLSYKDSVYSISIFESIVSFRIQRDRCFESSPTSNEGISIDAEDFRHKGDIVDQTTRIQNTLTRRLSSLERFILIRKLLLKVSGSALHKTSRFYSKIKLRNLRKYF